MAILDTLSRPDFLLVAWLILNTYERGSSCADSLHNDTELSSSFYDITQIIPEIDFLCILSAFLSEGLISTITVKRNIYKSTSNAPLEEHSKIFSPSEGADFLRYAYVDNEQYLQKHQRIILNKYLYTPNIKKLQGYIDDYLKIWKSNKMHKTSANMLKSELQIKYVGSILQKAFDESTKSKYYIDLEQPKNADFVATFLYLESKDVITNLNLIINSRTKPATASFTLSEIDILQLKALTGEMNSNNINSYITKASSSQSINTQGNSSGWSLLESTDDNIIVIEHITKDPKKIRILINGKPIELPTLRDDKYINAVCLISLLIKHSYDKDSLVDLLHNLALTYKKTKRSTKATNVVTAALADARNRILAGSPYEIPKDITPYILRKIDD